VALLVHGERDEVRIAETLADLGSLGRGGGRGLVVTRGRLLHQGGEQQITLLDAVPPLVFKEALRAAEPAGCATHLPSRREVDAEPEGTAHSA
jgi:hypothetical protein